MRRSGSLSQILARARLEIWSRRRNARDQRPGREDGCRGQAATIRATSCFCHDAGSRSITCDIALGHSLAGRE